MAQFIVSLANDGEFERVYIEAEKVTEGPDGTLTFFDSGGNAVSSFDLWAWWSEHERVGPP